MKGLTFFTKNSGGDLDIISYHHPRSITWRFVLSFCRYRGDEKRSWGLTVFKKPRFQGVWRLNFGSFGFLYFALQESMFRGSK